MYQKYLKRICDWLLSTVAILLLSWLLLILAIVIKTTSKGPVFFRQKRVGKDKTYFQILKFRTMRVDTPKDMPTHLLTNPDQYITPIGKFLRKTSLDELPQLFNIFCGQMAIVGPRPALWNQEDLIAERERYHANGVRPGLTGLAQVSGRDELAIPVKARYDGEYVKKITFLGDCSLILRTVSSVVRHDGVKEGGTGAAGEFAATKEEEKENV
uniref:sugar transferase n=1 Tax=Anaerosporobacter faecicola TaxID=2718714 RepID=UPI00236827A6|nr:sugar transferase [Anaerosporobacter faecicola]